MNKESNKNPNKNPNSWMVQVLHPHPPLCGNSQTECQRLWLYFLKTDSRKIKLYTPLPPPPSYFLPLFPFHLLKEILQYPHWGSNNVSSPLCSNPCSNHINRRPLLLVNGILLKWNQVWSKLFFIDRMMYRAQPVYLWCKQIKSLKPL